MAQCLLGNRSPSMVVKARLAAMNPQKPLGKRYAPLTSLDPWRTHIFQQLLPACSLWGCFGIGPWEGKPKATVLRMFHPWGLVHLQDKRKRQGPNGTTHVPSRADPFGNTWVLVVKDYQTESGVHRFLNQTDSHAWTSHLLSPCEASVFQNWAN